MWQDCKNMIFLTAAIARVHRKYFMPKTCLKNHPVLATINCIQR
ncbi:hypothetical protein [Chroogloeocystis siderophila]|nr:hypothetical protein [Chroogloeocystis siderophila]